MQFISINTLVDFHFVGKYAFDRLLLKNSLRGLNRRYFDADCLFERPVRAPHCESPARWSILNELVATEKNDVVTFIFLGLQQYFQTRFCKKAAYNL